MNRMVRYTSLIESASSCIQQFRRPALNQLQSTRLVGLTIARELKIRADIWDRPNTNDQIQSGAAEKGTNENASATSRFGAPIIHGFVFQVNGRHSRQVHRHLTASRGSQKNANHGVDPSTLAGTNFARVPPGPSDSEFREKSRNRRLNGHQSVSETTQRLLPCRPASLGPLSVLRRSVSSIRRGDLLWERATTRLAPASSETTRASTHAAA